MQGDSGAEPIAQHDTTVDSAVSSTAQLSKRIADVEAALSELQDDARELRLQGACWTAYLNTLDTELAEAPVSAAIVPSMLADTEAWVTPGNSAPSSAVKRGAQSTRARGTPGGAGLSSLTPSRQGSAGAAPGSTPLSFPAMLSNKLDALLGLDKDNSNSSSASTGTADRDRERPSLMAALMKPVRGGASTTKKRAPNS